MKILYWMESFNDEGKRNLIRETTYSRSLKDYILKMLKRSLIDKMFIKDPEYVISIHRDIAQIRIPKDDYNLLRPDVKYALVHGSVHKKDEDAYGGEYWKVIRNTWMETNYWEPSKAYTFDFDSYVIRLEEDGVEFTSINFMPNIHPFIDEFIGCLETRWGEAGEVENIKKWQI